MFNAPPEQATEVFASLPDSLRVAERPSRWAVARHADAAMHSFLEGPSFDRAGNLYTVDIAHGRILRISPKGEFSLVAQYDGEPNGLKIHRDGTLYIADHRHGILRLRPGGATPEPVCKGPADGGSFLGVNDLFFARNGDLYFTDQGFSDLVQPTGRVFRLRAGGALELLLSGLPSPNGLVLTADEKALLVAVTKANAVWRVPLYPDGALGRVGLFIQMSGSAGGGPDGLAMDEAGNLAVAHPLMGAVWLFSPMGEPLLRVRSCSGAATTNLAYGGVDRKSLYITESHTGTVLRCPMPVAGREMYSHANPDAAGVASWVSAT